MNQWISLIYRFNFFEYRLGIWELGIWGTFTAALMPSTRWSIFWNLDYITDSIK